MFCSRSQVDAVGKTKTSKRRENDVLRVETEWVKRGLMGAVISSI
jgi:hypothetical protein